MAWTLALPAAAQAPSAQPATPPEPPAAPAAPAPAAPAPAASAPAAPQPPAPQPQPPQPRPPRDPASAAAPGAVAPDAGSDDSGADDDADAKPNAPPAPAPPAVANVDVSACVEKLPEGKSPPKLEETFPRRGLSGHATVLTVVVHHGRGEKVLPSGLALSLDSEETKALEAAGFVIPDPEGGAPPSMETKTEGERSVTTLELPVVALPEEPGRQTLTLPPLPIAIARASGELMTVCTKPHDIVISDPIANEPNPKPKENPAPRRQREIWVAAKHAAVAALAALVVGGLLAWLFTWWRRRPKPQPPPAPPRPPWEVALEELFDIKNAGLIDRERYAEHFARVSHTIRRYLGERYGYDGLESTTREALAVLRDVQPPLQIMDRVEAFLRQADLVKFARLTPSAEECELALARGEDIVEKTMPFMAPSNQAEGRAAPTEASQRAHNAPTGTAPTGTAPTGTAPTDTAPTDTAPATSSQSPTGRDEGGSQ